MRRVALVTLFGALAALGACSLTTDLSGLSNGAPDAVEGGGTDAASDVATVQGPDGGRDASDAAVLGFCASHPGHAVCEDFDDGGLPSGWTADVTMGSVDVSTKRAASLPGALFATIPRRPAGVHGAARLAAERRQHRHR